MKMEVNDLQPRKIFRLAYMTDGGILIEVNDVQN